MYFCHARRGSKHLAKAIHEAAGKDELLLAIMRDFRCWCCAARSVSFRSCQSYAPNALWTRVSRWPFPSEALNSHILLPTLPKAIRQARLVNYQLSAA